MRTGILAFLLLATLGVTAKAEWIDLPLDGGGTLKAVLEVPEGTGPFPAVVYLHGTVVRERGYGGAAERGYDVAAFARDLAKRGFVALAAIRETPAGSDNGDQAVDEGIRAALAGRALLESRTDVRPGAVGLMGFSEGGLIGLWTLSRPDHGFAAAAILSPATMGGNRSAARTRSSRAFTKKGHAAKVAGPVLLTRGKAEGRKMKWVKGVHKAIKAAGGRARFKGDFPGDHKWFQSPRGAFMTPVAKQLRTWLSGD